MQLLGIEAMRESRAYSDASRAHLSLLRQLQLRRVGWRRIHHELVHLFGQSLRCAALITVAVVVVVVVMVVGEGISTYSANIAAGTWPMLPEAMRDRLEPGMAKSRW